jgi:hypothetical protein
MFGEIETATVECKANDEGAREYHGIHVKDLSSYRLYIDGNDTYANKETLKAAGYKFRRNNWGKELPLEGKNRKEVTAWVNSVIMEGKTIAGMEFNKASIVKAMTQVKE